MGGCFSGGCFSPKQAAEPAARSEASNVSRSGSPVNAAETPASNTNVLPELASGISRLKQSTDSGVASTSIECCSTGLPSSRYGLASARLRRATEVLCAGQSSKTVRSCSSYLTFLSRRSTSGYSNFSAVTPTSVLPPIPHGSRNNHVWTHSYYVKVRNLRDGSSGSVHLAVDLRNGSQVAIKFIPRGSSRCVADITSIKTNVH